jgi:hypothetical protein
MVRTCEDACNLNRDRREQGLRLDEFMHDTSLLRAIVMDELESFCEMESALEDRQAADLHPAHDLFDNITASSVREYVIQHECRSARVNAALAVSVGRAKEVAQARIKSVRTFSHELRNGADVLNIVTTLLAEAGEERETREACVATLRRNMVGMLALLNGEALSYTWTA